MKIKFMVLSICFLLIFSSIVFGKEKGIILTQEGAPVVILKYKPSWAFHPGIEPNYVQHEVQIKNVSEKKIVALKFKFMSLNVFNEFLGEMNYINVPDFGGVNPGSKAEMDGRQLVDDFPFFMCYRAKSFINYGTGIAYVSKVRFEDGTIWEADESNISEQLEEIQSSVNLIEKK